MFRISSFVFAFFLMSSLMVPMAAQQAVPPATITGSGTADYVPIFTGATTIGNSTIFQTVGGNVGCCNHHARRQTGSQRHGRCP